MENDYSYLELLTRIYKKLDRPNNINVIPMTIPIPKKYYISSNRCVWINFREICIFLNRHPRHFCNFILDNYRIKCKKNENNIYILETNKININLKHILQSYIKACVQCNKCNNIYTVMLKNDTIKCNNCNAFSQKDVNNTFSQNKKDISDNSIIGNTISQKDISDNSIIGNP